MLQRVEQQRKYLGNETAVSFVARRSAGTPEAEARKRRQGRTLQLRIRRDLTRHR